MGSTVLINGKNLGVPRDFFEVGVKASFGEDIQSNLTTEEFTFVLEAYKEILEWVQNGKNGGVGIFEGIPISIIQSDDNQNVSVFDGVLDLQNNAIFREALREVSVRIRQSQSLDQLADLIEPLDFGYLKDIGLITSSDYVNVDYVVNPIDERVETITTFITIYLLSKQLADSVKEIGTNITAVAAISASGLTGPVGGTIYAIGVAILQIAYAVTLLILLIDFGADLFNILVQPLRTHKGILLKTLLEKTCEHIGYKFETTIEDLENLVYLPSNRNVDQFGLKSILSRPGEITEGIPNISDSGYTCTEMFELVRELFNARFAIVENTVQFHTESSDYWVSQSGWEKPNTLQNPEQRPKRYNTDELKSSILIQFQTDITDKYTIQNYKGTAFQILTDAKSVQVPENKTIKGLDRVDLPFALANRKGSLSPLEEALLPIANLFDNLGGVFFGNPNLSRKIKTKTGVLEVSDNNHSVPKLIWMDGTRIPENHRDIFSARTIWNKYHSEKSFVLNGFSRQRQYVENEKIPFRFADFVTLLNNAYFRDQVGTLGKIVDLEWRMNQDYAFISYWLEEIYTTNLQETYIEPE